MNNIVLLHENDHPERIAAAAEARAWVIRLDGGPSRQELAEFRRWLDKNPLHRSEFKRVAELWDGMDELVQELVFPDTNKIAAAYRRVGFSSLGAAACLLLVFIGLQVIMPHIGHTYYSASYATDIGELKEVTLPDGSGLRLNTNSQASIDYGRGIRSVRLIKGEVHFDVSHDPDHPFVVYVEDVAIRALGTAFAVHIKDDQTEVTVTEGRVRILSMPQAPAGTDELGISEIELADILGTLSRGQQAILKNEIEWVEKIQPEEIEKQLSWRDGMLIFEHKPLEDVINEISRYTEMEIIILDAEIKQMEFGGYFPVGEIDLMLKSLTESFGIHVEKANEKRIYLSRR